MFPVDEGVEPTGYKRQGKGEWVTRQSSEEIIGVFYICPMENECIWEPDGRGNSMAHIDKRDQ